jgi:squalene-hopene/tetraprenyl-beta-curcumene cyclase
MPYAAGMRDGGFIYATGPEADQATEGQSQAGTYEETLDDGTVVSRLRSYGSMTYAGFKSYIYADLPRDDTRVQAARQWIGRHYTLEENPGLGDAGYYYYLVAFGRALDAWGEPMIEAAANPDSEPTPRRWAEDLAATLAALQQPDGSFKLRHDRWLENDPVLVTAYGVLALQAALDNN